MSNPQDVGKPVPVSDENEKAIKSEGQFVVVMRRLVRNKAALFAGILLIIIILACLLAPLLTQYDYAAMDPANKFLPPSSEHWFGTDEYGRDIFARILYGGRNSLLLGVMATLLCIFIGIVVGIVCGYFGGRVDFIVMRFLEIFQSVPNTLLTICISAAFGTGLWNTVLAMGLGGMAQPIRLMRSQVMSIRSSEYLEASTSINAGTFRILLTHVLPNSLSPIIVHATSSIGMIILGAAGLSFLGMGVQPPEAEWGAMLVEATSYIQHYPLMTIWPGLMIALTVFGFNTLGDGLRDAMDPKMRD